MTGIMERLRQANIQRQLEWDTGMEPITLEFFGNELAGEVGEACNVIKKIARWRIGLRGGLDPDQLSTEVALAKELADAIIVIDLIATKFGINLPTAIVSKFNYTSEKQGLSTMLDDDEEDRVGVYDERGRDHYDAA